MKLIIKDNKAKRAVHRISIVSKSSIHFEKGFIDVDQWNRGTKAIAFDPSTQSLVITGDKP